MTHKPGVFQHVCIYSLYVNVLWYWIAHAVLESSNEQVWHSSTRTFSQTDRQRGYLHLNKHISDSFSLPHQRGLIAVHWQPWDLSLFPQIHFFKSSSFSNLFYMFIWWTSSPLPFFLACHTKSEHSPWGNYIKGGKKQKKRIISDIGADRGERMHNICVININKELRSISTVWFSLQQWFLKQRAV